MDWTTLLLTIVLSSLIIRYFFSRTVDRLEKDGILRIKPVPIFGNMARAIFRRNTFGEIIDRTYKLDEEAKYVGFSDFSEPVIMIRSPELIKSIAIKNFDHFVNHRNFIDPDLDPLFGNNLFSLHGDKWKEMRNLLTPAFTSSKMKAMFKLMSNCAENFTDFFIHRAVNKPFMINGKDAFSRYTTDVIATCAFGICTDSMRNPNNDFYVLGKETMNFEGILSLKFFLCRNFPKISRFLNMRLMSERVEKFFESIVRETIETRDREGITRPDMIQLMMDSGKNANGEGRRMSTIEMTAQAFIFFFGGFDSSSTLMSFVAYEIAYDAKVQKKLLDEIDQVLAETNGELTYDAINNMQYLDAVINETLRVHTVAVFLDRICVKPFELPPSRPGDKPVTVEPGQNIWFPVNSIHHDPKYFTDPNKFDPERFMGSAKNEIDPSTYFPFGQGPRMCIGNRFALLETKVLIVHLLSKCRLRTSEKMIVPLQYSEASFSITAKGGFWFDLERRNTAAKTNGTANGH